MTLKDGLFGVVSTQVFRINHTPTTCFRCGDVKKNNNTNFLRRDREMKVKSILVLAISPFVVVLCF